LVLFRRPAFSVANAVAGAMKLGTLGLLFLLTSYLQTVQHRSALAAGVAMLPLFAPLCVLAPAAGRLTARVGPRLPMATGLLVAAAGVALLGRLHTDSGYGILLAAMLLWGTGLGLLTPAVVAAAMGSVPAAQAGLASGVNNTARQAGGAIGIAIFGALAGSATAGDHFVAGMQLAGLITAGLFLAAAVATVVVIPHTHRRHARKLTQTAERTLSSIERNIPRPSSVGPVSFSVACSGWGMRPTTRPSADATPAMARSEPLGFAPA